MVCFCGDGWWRAFRLHKKRRTLRIVLVTVVVGSAALYAFILTLSYGKVNPQIQASLLKESVMDAPFNSDTSTERIESPTLDPLADKRRILDILNEAGFSTLDNETIHKLPSWSDVVSLYGDHPRIQGLERCEEFRNRVPLSKRHVGVAGNFNSGTNHFHQLLSRNCHVPHKRYRIRWQVPWGKHNRPKDEHYRQTFKAGGSKKISSNNTLPLVTIRDFYTWAQSMCRQGYETQFFHTDRHCPNLVPDDLDRERFPKLNDTVPVTVYHTVSKKHYDSLVHFWNDFQRYYLDADFPRIIVRFEDLIFHSKQVIQTVCRCFGGELPNQTKFQYVVNSSKSSWSPKDGRTDFVDSIIRYGNTSSRTNGFHLPDLHFAKGAIDQELIGLFGYPNPNLGDRN